jgi:hypothetical protein
MTQLIVFEPKSESVKWLLSLKVHDQKNRMGVCFRKIQQLYWLSEAKNALAALELQAWTQIIKSMERSFMLQIKRISKVIERRVKAKIQYQSSSSPFKFELKNPIQLKFYELLSTFDHLMCLSETCLSLKLFKKGRFFIQRMERDKRAVTKLVARMSHVNAKTFSVA